MSKLRWARKRLPLISGLSILIVAVVVGALLLTRPTSYTPQAADAEIAAKASAQAAAVTQAPKMVLELPDSPTVLLLGDSFAQGHGAEPKSLGYAYLLADRLGWDITVDHEGRTGFIEDNKGIGKNYGGRIQVRIAAGEAAPDLVILQGSINDTSATTDQMVNAATATIESVKTAWPSTQVITVYPISYRDFSQMEIGLDRAAQSSETFVLTDGGWDTWLPKTDGLYSEDGWHPSTAGHARIADKMATAIELLMTPNA